MRNNKNQKGVRITTSLAGHTKLNTAEKLAVTLKSLISESRDLKKKKKVKNPLRKKNNTLRWDLSQIRGEGLEEFKKINDLYNWSENKFKSGKRFSDKKYNDSKGYETMGVVVGALNIFMGKFNLDFKSQDIIDVLSNYEGEMLYLNLNDLNLGLYSALLISHFTSFLSPSVPLQLNLRNNNFRLKGVDHLQSLIRNQGPAPLLLNLSENHFGLEGLRHIASAILENQKKHRDKLCKELHLDLSDNLNDYDHTCESIAERNEDEEEEKELDKGGCYHAPSSVTYSSILTEVNYYTPSSETYGSILAKVIEGFLGDKLCLDLSKTRFSVGEIELIASAIEVYEGDELFLAFDGNGFEESECAYFANGIREFNSAELNLDFSNNNFGPGGAEHLANAIAGRSAYSLGCGEGGILSLNLSHNNLGLDGAKHIADGVRSYHSSAHLFLDLTDNDIGEQGVQCIADAMDENPFSASRISITTGEKHLDHIITQTQSAICKVLLLLRGPSPHNFFALRGEQKEKGEKEEKEQEKDDENPFWLHIAAISCGFVKFMERIEGKSVEELSCALVRQDHDGRTTLHYAARYQTPLHVMQPAEVVFMYLIENVSPEALSEALVKQDKQGWTALHTAAVYQSADVFMALVKNLSPEELAKALLIENEDGETVLHLAARCQPEQACMKLITKVSPEALSKALVIQDSKGKTALHIAVDNKKSSVVLALIEESDLTTLNEVFSLVPKHCSTIDERDYFLTTITTALDQIEQSFTLNTENTNELLNNLLDCVRSRRAKLVDLMGFQTSEIVGLSPEGLSFKEKLDELLTKCEEEKEVCKDEDSESKNDETSPVNVGMFNEEDDVENEFKTGDLEEKSQVEVEVKVDDHSLCRSSILFQQKQQDSIEEKIASGDSSRTWGEFLMSPEVLEFFL